MHHKLIVEYVQMFCTASSDKNPQNYLLNTALKYNLEVRVRASPFCANILYGVVQKHWHKQLP